MTKPQPTPTQTNDPQNLSWISSKVTERHSGIQGHGLFALERIEKEEIIVIQSGKILEDRMMDSLQYSELSEIAFQIEKGFHICPHKVGGQYVQNGVFVMNHSCDPNCGIRGQITFVALRAIEVGEEITFDYAMTDANFEDMQCTPISPMQCSCGTLKCRKMITGDDWKSDELQRKYKGRFSNYIQTMIDQIKD